MVSMVGMILAVVFGIEHHAVLQNTRYPSSAERVADPSADTKQMRRKGSAFEVNPTRTGHFVDLGVDGRIILIWILGSCNDPRNGNKEDIRMSEPVAFGNQ